MGCKGLEEPVEDEGDLTDSVKVYILGGGFVTMPVSEETTFAHLRYRVGAKLGIPAGVGRAFDLFPVVGGYERAPRSYLEEGEEERGAAAGGGGGGSSRVPPNLARMGALNKSVVSSAMGLRSGEGAGGEETASPRVLETMEQFKLFQERLLEQAKSHVHAREETYLVYKKYDFRPSTEFALEAIPACLRLLFHQTVRGVVFDWPVDEDGGAYVDLAALQMVAAFGPPAGGRQLPSGFLTRDHELLGEYVPNTMLEGISLAAKRSLEAEILDKYAHTPVETVEDAMRAYLVRARTLRMYGATVFQSAKAYTSIKRVIHGRIIVAISGSRLGFIESQTRKLVGCYHWSHVQQWGGEHAHNSWTCTILSAHVHKMLKSGTHKIHGSGSHLVRSGSGDLHPLKDSESTLYKFITPQGHFMSQVAARAVRQNMASDSVPRSTGPRTSPSSSTPRQPLPLTTTPVREKKRKRKRTSRPVPVPQDDQAVEAGPVVVAEDAGDAAEEDDSDPDAEILLVDVKEDVAGPGVSAEEAFSDWDEFSDDGER